MSLVLCHEGIPVTLSGPLILRAVTELRTNDDPKQILGARTLFQQLNPKSAS